MGARHQTHQKWIWFVLADPVESQYESSPLFRILWRYTADYQSPVQIWVAIRAMTLRARSNIDFLGGSGGI